MRPLLPQSMIIPGASTMRVISVNVGRPQTLEWQGRTVSTAIFKAPVAGAVVVRGQNLAGDEQADLTVHGGRHKAVYLYPSEHYAYWRAELPGVELGWGAFGENLTVEGLDESIAVGDLLEVGTALLRVTEARMPCYKLGLRFGRPDMTKRFLQSRRTGFYAAIEREGELRAGDEIRHLLRGASDVTIADMVQIYGFPPRDPALAARVLALPDLSAPWREFLTSHQ
nr:MOSC domain-containing protein [Oscillochloris sp. ZM17-4]